MSEDFAIPKCVKMEEFVMIMMVHVPVSMDVLEPIVKPAKVDLYS